MVSENNSRNNPIKVSIFFAIILILMIIGIVVVGVLAKDKQPAVSEPKPELTWNWSEDYAEAELKIKTEGVIHVEDATVTSVRTEPTCDTDGQVVYTASVEYRGNTYTETKTEILSAEEYGHEYEFTKFIWNEDLTDAKIEFVCKRDGSHVILRSATITTASYEPTCEEDGIKNISAVLHLDGETYIDNQKSKTSPKLGHAYKFSKWIWDGANAKAEFVCEHDKTHIVTENGVVTEISRKDAACEENGEIEYSATVSYNGEVYTDTHTEIINAHGHKYNISWNWSADKKTAQANFVCANDESHKFTENAEVTEEVRDGQTVYTATVIYREQTYTDEQTVSSPAEEGTV